MNELLQRADNHYSKSLMKFRAWQPWRKLILNRRKQEQIADTAFSKCCLRFVDHYPRTILHCIVLCKTIKQCGILLLCQPLDMFAYYANCHVFIVF